jgi:homoserine kinase
LVGDVRVTARVPATAANLGAGFDCFGIALELRSEVVLDLGKPFAIEVEGEGQDRLPRDGRNLVARTIHGFFERLGRPTPPYRLTLRNRIPQTGGLGSSSAALVGALLVANVAAGRPRSLDELLCLAAELEGHPDNVAPAVLGGLVVAVAEPDAGLITVPLAVPPELSAVLFVPSFVMRTRRARQLLPKLVPHRDAVFNASRTALLVSAFQSGRFDLLRVAMQDRLHQPYRSQLFPAMGSIFEAALAAGACGACLSGAGSAILAFTTDRQSLIGEAMQRAALGRGVEGRWLTADVARAGAEVVVAD